MSRVGPPPPSQQQQQQRAAAGTVSEQHTDGEQVEPCPAALKRLLQQAPAEVLAAMPRLLLTGAVLGVFPTRHLAHFTGLRVLDMSKNVLQIVPWRWIARTLTQLVTLSVAHNLLRDLTDVQYLALLRHLESLDLTNNPCARHEDAHITVLKLLLAGPIDGDNVEERRLASVNIQRSAATAARQATTHPSSQPAPPPRVGRAPALKTVNSKRLTYMDINRAWAAACEDQAEACMKTQQSTLSSVAGLGRKSSASSISRKIQREMAAEKAARVALAVRFDVPERPDVPDVPFQRPSEDGEEGDETEPTEPVASPSRSQQSEADLKKANVKARLAMIRSMSTNDILTVDSPWFHRPQQQESEAVAETRQELLVTRKLIAESKDRFGHLLPEPDVNLVAADRQERDDMFEAHVAQGTPMSVIMVRRHREQVELTQKTLEDVEAIRRKAQAAAVNSRAQLADKATPASAAQAPQHRLTRSQSLAVVPVDKLDVELRRQELHDAVRQSVAFAQHALKRPEELFQLVLKEDAIQQQEEAHHKAWLEHRARLAAIEGTTPPPQPSPLTSPGSPTARSSKRVFNWKTEHSSPTRATQAVWWENVATVEDVLAEPAPVLLPGSKEKAELMKKCIHIRRKAQDNLSDLNRSHSAFISQQVEWEGKRRNPVFLASQAVTARLKSRTDVTKVGETVFEYSALFK